jgi:hypothetical protein
MLAHGHSSRRSHGRRDHYQDSPSDRGNYLAHFSQDRLRLEGRKGLTERG